MEDADEGVAPRDMERRRFAPGEAAISGEDRGETKFGGRSEEKAAGAGEVGGVAGVRRKGEAEPAEGIGIEGECLVTLKEDVVVAVEEEPRRLLLGGDGDGEGGGGDGGAPELAHGGCADDGFDGKVGEDEFREVGS